jgi:multidrug efflux pump subunit AcrA (membrane-fusion protein)
MSRRVQLGAVVGLLLLLGGLAAYRGLALPRDRGGTRRPAREVTVRVAEARRGQVRHVLQTTGDILPLLQVELIPKVSGTVAAVEVQIGQAVAAGQVLVRLEQTEFLQRVAETEAKVARAAARVAELQAGSRPEEIRQAEETLRQAASRRGNARLNRDRIRDLFATGAVSQRDLDEAELAVSLTEAQQAAAEQALALLRQGPRAEVRAAAEAELKEAEAVLAQQRTLLDYSAIRAPFAGHITRRLVDPGATVGPSAPVATLVSLQTVKVLLAVPERDSPLLTPRSSSVIRVDAFPGRTFPGRVARINSALDPLSRTLAAEIHADNPEGLLLPGMFARAEVTLLTREGILVPSEAVLEEGGAAAVFVVGEGGTAKRRPVETGYLQGTLIEIRQGLSGGEAVVVAGQQGLRDGAAVRLLEGSANP